MNGVIYARYSSDNQREESIEGQIRECKEFAERQGIVVIGTGHILTVLCPQKRITDQIFSVW